MISIEADWEWTNRYCSVEEKKLVKEANRNNTVWSKVLLMSPREKDLPIVKRLRLQPSTPEDVLRVLLRTPQAVFHAADVITLSDHTAESSGSYLYPCEGWAASPLSLGK